MSIRAKGLEGIIWSVRTSEMGVKALILVLYPRSQDNHSVYPLTSMLIHFLPVCPVLFSKYDLPELTPDLSNCGPVKPVHFSFLSQFNHFYILSQSNQSICHLQVYPFFTPRPSKTNPFLVAVPVKPVPMSSLSCYNQCLRPVGLVMQGMMCFIKTPTEDLNIERSCRASRQQRNTLK